MSVSSNLQLIKESHAKLGTDKDREWFDCYLLGVLSAFMPSEAWEKAVASALRMAMERQEQVNKLMAECEKGTNGHVEGDHA